ncbi:MAG: hypothetical protein Q8R98_29340 [Rubrivivax sp.]|jgi:hypothetical protein|nr:hypothetical protein [Rubrivivax sp.]MDP3224180.1 hypothetical protein [Rubrivivax sp.]MDP3615963.1 hypothetical protein [Rubrivivax sp.]
MLKMTLLATSAIGATLFAVAAVLPVLATSRGGDASSPPVSTSRTLSRAPAQDTVRANDEGLSGATERRPDMRRDDRLDAERKKDHDRSDD